MDKHATRSSLCGLAVLLLVVSMALSWPALTPARAAIIGTPTSAGLLVCVKQGTVIKPAGDAGGQASVTVCNTPAAGGAYKTVGGSKVLGLAVLDDGQDQAVIHVRDARVPTTTTYTLTLSIRLGAASLVAGLAVDYRAGDYSNLRAIFDL